MMSRPQTDERFLASGDEAGTAPDDRRFRPDVEGLRAVAVLLVVLYHAGVRSLPGGFIGVDVFFVISGFVITGLLLRERQGTRRTSILDFYARRVRRILPAATLVILVTVLGAYVVLGVVSGNTTADGRWAAAFLANFHFEAIGTNYLSASRLPSPLQNYWSLSVEEQFYVVYPTLFLLVAAIKGRLSLRIRMVIALGIVIVASYSMSIVQTASHPTAAYFSPFTRAWELALGALVAVATSWLKHLPAQLAELLTWGGLAGIFYAAVAFNAQTPYPGSLVAVPVIGAALVIAGGVANPKSGAESLLGLQPFQWLGKRSYSLYLWHWPILIIAAESVGKATLPLGKSLLLVLLALAISMATYRLVENPIRHWRLPSKQSVVAGVTLVVTTIVVLTLLIDAETTPPTHYHVIPAANTQVVLDQVAAATKITTVPKSVEPSLSQAGSDFVGWGGILRYGCTAAVQPSAFSEPICTIGDVNGRRLMVLYGDSHALMWLPAFQSIAKSAHWRLVVFARYFCPAEILTVANHPAIGRAGGPFTQCDKWHAWVVKTINQMKPNLVVVTQESLYQVPGLTGSQAQGFTTPQWELGLTKLLQGITTPNIRKVILGNIPMLPQSGPVCLAAHTDDVQACSAPVQSSVLQLNQAERSTAATEATQYIDPTPWFCSATCTAIIARYGVYQDQYHVTGSYAKYLRNALAQALGFPLIGKVPLS